MVKIPFSWLPGRLRHIELDAVLCVLAIEFATVMVGTVTFTEVSIPVISFAGFEPVGSRFEQNRHR